MPDTITSADKVYRPREAAAMDVSKSHTDSRLGRDSESLLYAWAMAQASSTRVGRNEETRLSSETSHASRLISSLRPEIRDVAASASLESYLTEAVKRTLEKANPKASQKVHPEDAIDWEGGRLGAGKPVGTVMLEVSTRRAGRPLPVSD